MLTGHVRCPRRADTVFAGHCPTQIKGEVMPFPTARVKRARVLTDDFAPVEFLTTVKENNTRNE